MFFPKLTRQSEAAYHHSRGSFYADYRQNHEMVSTDCRDRCVYCDILLEEMGREGMQLDHFRPQKHFDTLKTHPHNLYLSCPKCNQLKSCDWPCSKEVGGSSFEGGIGYIDPFVDDPADYLYVNDEGKIIQKDGPVEYMIKRMYLNRQSRVYTRRRRLLNRKREQLSLSITGLLDKFSQELRDILAINGMVTEDILGKLQNIQVLKQQLDDC